MIDPGARIPRFDRFYCRRDDVVRIKDRDFLRRQSLQDRCYIAGRQRRRGPLVLGLLETPQCGDRVPFPVSYNRRESSFAATFKALPRSFEDIDVMPCLAEKTGCEKAA